MIIFIKHIYNISWISPSFPSPSTIIICGRHNGPPKDVHTLFSGISKYVMLHGKRYICRCKVRLRYLTNVRCKVKDLKTGIFILDHLSWSNIIIWAVKSRDLFLAGEGRKCSKIVTWRDEKHKKYSHATVCLRMTGVMCQRRDFSPTKVKYWNLNELGNGVFPSAFR